MTLSSSIQGSTLGAALLVAGCCIGAGMLGLPVVSAGIGFIPSIVAMMIAATFMIISGFLFLEATLWFDYEANMVSIAKFALGRFGKYLSWILFFLLFYCLMVAYAGGMGELISGIFSDVFPHEIPSAYASIFCVLVLGSIIFFGAGAVDRVNRIFMCVLGLSYVLLIAIGISNVNPEVLLKMQWKTIQTALPVMLISFGYQNLVPSLSNYLKRDVKRICITIVCGTIIAFFVYLLWQAVVLGILLQRSILEGSGDGSDMVTTLLEGVTHSPWVLLLANIFAFCAIVTTFITIGLSFIDFLADGFHVQKSAGNRLWLCGIILIPPLLFSLHYPQIFLSALGYAGGVVTTLLFGVLPALIVWVGRYRKKIDKPQIIGGGKYLLVLMIIFALFTMCVELGYLK